MRSPRKSRQISIPSRSLLPRGNLQFNHLLVKDDEPLLFHPRARAECRRKFAEVISKLIYFLSCATSASPILSQASAGSLKSMAGRQRPRADDLQPGWRACERERLH
jgi:hypothetical protein